MNDSALRRKQLLEETRKLYSDSESTPLIHPRFNVFRDYNGEVIADSEEQEVSSFKFRLVIAAIVFASFVTMDYYGYAIGNYDSNDVMEVISTEIDIEEVWNSI